MFLLCILPCADKQGWAPTCDTVSGGAYAGVDGHFDFIELGTNDFDTLAQLALPCTRGISIDAMQFYLDRLPDKPLVRKLNYAIGEKADPMQTHLDARAEPTCTAHARHARARALHACARHAPRSSTTSSMPAWCGTT